MDRTLSAASVPESMLRGPVRSSHPRTRVLTIVTLAFWGLSFGVATLANAFGDLPNLASMLAARSGLYTFGLALCFVLYRVLEAAGPSVFSRIRALALVVPLAAGICTWGSLAISQYVGGEFATVAEIVRTFTRWLWFFVGWSAASLAVEYYFEMRAVAQSLGEWASREEHVKHGAKPASIAESAKRPKLWIGFEVTSDISRASRGAAHDFCEAFNRALDARQWRSSLASFDVMLVIMNPQIAPPLAEGSVLRRELNRFECRVRLDSLRWVQGDRNARIGLVKEAVSIALDQVPSDAMSRSERATLDFALESAVLATYASSGDNLSTHEWPASQVSVGLHALEVQGLNTGGKAQLSLKMPPLYQLLVLIAFCVVVLEFVVTALLVPAG